jgi:integrase
MSRSREPISVGHRVMIAPRGKRGIYTAEYHLDGQHRRKSLHTTALKIATSRAIVLAARLEEGAFEGANCRIRTRIERATLEDAVKDFLENLCVEDSTSRRYRCMLGHFVASCRRQKVYATSGVTRRTVDAWQAKRRTAVIESTCHIEWNLVRQFLAWCFNRKMIAENLLAAEKSPYRKADKADGALTLTQIERILAKAENPSRPPLLVLAMSGVRAAECCHLRKGDVDLDGGWLHVVSREGAKTKTKRSRRVPVHPILRPLLERLVQDRGELLLSSPRRMTAIIPSTLNKHFLSVCKAAGIPAGQPEGFTIRSLRHFFKSYCISQGVPREYIDDWQGHSRMTRASDRYVHTYDEESQRFIAQVNFDTFRRYTGDST